MPVGPPTCTTRWWWGAARRAGRRLYLAAPVQGACRGKGHLRWADNDHRRSGELSRRGKDRRPFAHRNHAPSGPAFRRGVPAGRSARDRRGRRFPHRAHEPGGFPVLRRTARHRAHPRKVGFEGEETFRGRGVAYCATCDGGFFTDRDVFVVGGRIRRAEEAMFLTRYARSVTMLVRRSTLSCAESIAEQVLAHDPSGCAFNTVLEAGGRRHGPAPRRVPRHRDPGGWKRMRRRGRDIRGIRLRGVRARVAAGRRPCGADGQGNIVTDREQRTRTEGVYAAGDVCDKRLRQVVTAVSDGAVAATSIERYAADMQRKTGLRPQRPATAPRLPEPRKPQPLPGMPARQKAGSSRRSSGNSLRESSPAWNARSS